MFHSNLTIHFNFNATFNAQSSVSLNKTKKGANTAQTELIGNIYIFFQGCISEMHLVAMNYNILLLFFLAPTNKN